LMSVIGSSICSAYKRMQRFLWQGRMIGFVREAVTCRHFSCPATSPTSACPFCRGTNGSNPFSSGGESVANSI
jgi:hypothetical protein